MILTGPQILAEVKAGRIHIEPFSPDHVTTNSYDLHLGSTFVRYRDEVLDMRAENASDVITVEDELVMARGEFLLGETYEVIGSDHFVPIIHARSGAARLGLFVHVTADLFDLGYLGRSTLQLHSVLPIRLRPRMGLAQVSFWVPEGERMLYDGKYQHGTGPQTSKSYIDAGPRRSA